MMGVVSQRRKRTDIPAFRFDRRVVNTVPLMTVGTPPGNTFFFFKTGLRSLVFGV